MKLKNEKKMSLHELGEIHNPQMPIKKDKYRRCVVVVVVRLTLLTVIKVIRF